MRKKLVLAAPVMLLPVASCVNQAVLQRRAVVWEEEAAVLESRGDARGAGELRDLAARARGQGRGPSGEGEAPPGSRLDSQVGNLFRRARIHYRESRLAEARFVLAEALEKDPAHRESLDLRSRIESESFVPRKDKPFADMAAELFDKGMRRLRRGETREAFDLLSQARQVYREDEVLERAYSRCAAELQAMEDSLRANDLFKKGRELLDSGQPAEADALFAQAQELDPQLPRIGEYRKQAEESVRRARLQAISSKLSGAKAKAAKGNFDGAESDLRALLSLDPENAEGLALKADLEKGREGAERRRSEEEAYNAALRAGWDALERRDADAARRALGEARALKPGKPELEELEKKIIRVEEGRDPTVKADAAYRKGMVAYRQGRPDEAAGFFREALRLEVGHSKATKALLRLGSGETEP